MTDWREIHGRFYSADHAQNHSGEETRLDVLNHPGKPFISFCQEEEESVVLIHKARFRGNYFNDHKGYGAVFRQVPVENLTAQQLGLPDPLLSRFSVPRRRQGFGGRSITRSQKRSLICTTTLRYSPIRGDAMAILATPVPRRLSTPQLLGASETGASP